MNPVVLVGTSDGLRELGPSERTHLGGHDITALARDGERWWVITDGRGLWRGGEHGSYEAVATLDGPSATCLAPTRAGLLVGTASAHLFRLDEAGLARVESFDAADGRRAWYTPWGDPPDTRSIASGADGALYVNVHVGGVLRSDDAGRSWSPTLDIEADVHQVLAHPDRVGLVLAAAAVGLGLSADGGRTWRFETEGLHARYMRAVAVSGETILATASTGPGARKSAVYRCPLAPRTPFERCRGGLPEWFASNVDTHCLAAAGAMAALGTDDGRVFLSEDGGERWELLAKGLAPVQCVALGPGRRGKPR